MTMPNWREALKELEAELKAHPQPEAPLPQPETASVAETVSKPEHHHRTRVGKVVKKEEVKPVEKPKPEKKPAAKPKAEKKPATQKSPSKAKAPVKSK